jgi:hypothetical protein
VHPLGGSVLVKAEQVGEDSSGELGGEVEEGGAAAGLGVDAEGSEPFAERGRGDGAAGQVAGEQPGGLLRGADAAVTAPVVDELAAMARSQSMAWAPSRLQRAPVMPIRSATRWRQAPSMTPVAIGQPSARARG